jgi:hypothetical protein
MRETVSIECEREKIEQGEEVQLGNKNEKEKNPVQTTTKQ